jgi:hypothetical protein
MEALMRNQWSDISQNLTGRSRTLDGKGLVPLIKLNWLGGY